MNRKTLLYILLGSYLAVFVWSLIRPVDYLIWFLEVGPVVVGGLVLLFTYRKFPLSTYTYILIWITAIVMTIGGHYTYVEVPVFDWVRDTFGLRRNHYDRLGHFVQGFTIAAVMRELLLRRSPLMPGKWLFFIVACMCLAFSASYEIIEFAASKILRRSAEAFLGHQGDVWDSQWDMTFAVTGAICSLLVCSRYQDRHVWEADRS